MVRRMGLSRTCRLGWVLGLSLVVGCNDEADAGRDARAETEVETEVEIEIEVESEVEVESESEVESEVEVEVTPTHPALISTVPGTFTVRPGVEIATVFGATPGTPVTLYDAHGVRLLSVVADEYGQAHFSYVPPTYQILDLTGAVSGELVKYGHVLTPGDGYVIRDDTPLEAAPAAPPKAVGPFRVLSVEDHPDTALYDRQTLQGIHYGLFGTVDGEDPDDGLNYIEVRDGVFLSAMVRFPDPTLWGDGPYPTVIEYSGYSPSDPASPDPGSRIATLLGYASVGVNMRGSGCSGGVFDIFSPAQHADGYDVVEVVARQSWALHHKVGMVGLSYPGIAQLYVAYTRPPSLAAVTPLSVLADPWQQLRPGGIYNDGFTRQWLENRDSEAAPNGQSWTDKRIVGGDTRCETHQVLRNQNLAFEDIFKALEFVPPDAAARSLPLLVGGIAAPVYLTGAFQDEQTGPLFQDMLGQFGGAAVRRFILYNGRHPDGYSPLVLTRWWEFLELYVAKRVPRLPDWVRLAAGPEISREYDSTGLGFEVDRFAAFAVEDYAGVKAAYEAEPEVRVMFESGGGDGQPGAPEARWVETFSAWPPPEGATRRFYLSEPGDGGDGGLLAETAPVETVVDAYTHDTAAGSDTFFTHGYDLMTRIWDTTWKPFPAGKSLSFLSAQLAEAMTIAGPSYAELWVASGATDVGVQVTITEVRPDGAEYLVQSGALRIGHRGVDEDASEGNFVTYTFTEEDYAPVAEGERVHTKIPIPQVAHVFRGGSRLRVIISTPGRDFGTWEFANPDYGATTPEQEVWMGGETPSALVVSVIPPGEIQVAYPVCPGLRGQPCRTYVPTANRRATE